MKTYNKRLLCLSLLVIVACLSMGFISIQSVQARSKVNLISNQAVVVTKNNSNELLNNVDNSSKNVNTQNNDNEHNQTNNNVQNNVKPKRVNKYWSHWSKKGYVDLRSKMTYVSQLKPVYMPDACEAASLKMALSIKDKAKRVSLHRMVNRIGWRWHGNPNYEYSNNPYRRDGATIFPAELVRIARWYGANGKIANHSSKNKLIHALQRKDPIVIEAGHKMHMWSDHIVALIGYRHALHSKLDQFEYADPESYRPLIRWVNTKIFMKVYDRPVTGGRAAIIL